MRGRKPKPTALHVADGTYRADRHGPRPVAPGPTLFPELDREIPQPPANLQGAALRIWHETVRELERLGTLDTADRGLIALYAEARAELGWAMNRVRKEGRIVATAAGGQKPHPAMGIKNAAALRASRFASDLGLTPTARARLRLGTGFGPPPEDPDESDLD